MRSVPMACGSLRVGKASDASSTVTRRLAMILSMLLLGEGLVDCEGMESHTQGLTATSSQPKCAGHIPHIRDGRCNEANNNADCGFDGGDCCASTCIAGLAYACGGDQEGGFDCRDPHVAIDPRRRLNSESCGGFPGSIGDTKCDSINNNFECSYDGGDCCKCTCSPELLAALVEEAYLTKSDVTECLDCFDPTCYAVSGISVPSPTPGPIYDMPVPSPKASPVQSPKKLPVAHPTASHVARPTANPVASSTASPGPSPTPIPASSPAFTTSECGWPNSSIGDGDCDFGTNNLECNWDGGDCCECTCQETDEYQCPSFDCLDPDAPTDCGSTGSWTTSSRSTVSPVPSPMYASPAPSPSETPGQASPGEISPVSRPTERPVPSPTEAPEGSDNRDTESSSSVTGSGSASAEGGRSSQSASFTESGSSTGEGSGSLTASGRSIGDSGSSTDGDRSTYGEGLEEEQQEEEEEEEAVSTSSTTLAATTGTSVVLSWEVVAVLCASVLGYYMS